MRFVRATIYGFGKWVDHTIDFSKRSAIIYGENESGKSTIQMFILFMLFGLPPKKRTYYRPKTSGKMGGRLILFDPKVGEFTIERFDEVKNGAAVCYTADGEEQDEQWLKQRLHGMTLEAYRSVFAFSAMDLNDLHTMDGEDIGEILLGIGLSGSKNIHSMEKELDKRLGDWFKPYGTKPTINVQLEQVAQTEKELIEWREKEGTYVKKKEAAADATAQLNDAKQQLKQEQFRLKQAERKKQAVPLYQQYVMYRNQLKNFPAHIPFPENGKERLEKQQELLLPLQSEFNFLTSNEKAVTNKIADLEKKEIDASVYERAKEIVEEKPAYIAKKKEYEQMRNHVQKKEEQLEAKLEALSIPLNRAQLTDLQLPFYIENSWLERKREAEQLEAEQQQLETERKTLEEEQHFLESELHELNKRSLPEEEVKRLTEKINLSEEEQLRIRLQAEKERQRDEWEKLQEAEQTKRQRMMIQTSALALIILFLALFTSVDWLYPVSALFLIVAVTQWLLSKQTTTELETFFESEETSSSSSNIDQRTLTKMKQLLDENETIVNEKEKVQGKLKANIVEQIKLDERRSVYEDRKWRLQQNIEENYSIYPFLQGIKVTHWPELYHRLDSLVDIARELKADYEAVQALEQEMMTFEQRVNLFVEKQQITVIQPIGVIDLLEEIESFVQTYEVTLKDRKEYERNLEETKQKRSDLIERMDVYEQHMNELLQSAAVETVNDFYKQEKLYNEKQETENMLQQTEQQLDLQFPDSDWKKYIEEALDEQELEEQVREANARITELEEKIDRLHREVAELNAALATLEMSENYPTLLQQFGIEKETLQNQAAEWAVLKTAKEMLAQTKRSYRDKYVTRVMKKAEEIFRIVTANKYKRVFVPTEETPFQVEAQDGIRYDASELSKGTIDQLYISLRLAMNEMMSAQHQLPFMLDDAFVHFDSVRTERMLHVVEKISEQHQVILFTCKQEIPTRAKSIQTIDLAQQMQAL